MGFFYKLTALGYEGGFYHDNKENDMKRITDKPYYTYSVEKAAVSGIYVKCPECGGAAIVTADKSTACFRCTNCGKSKTKERIVYCCNVENLCDKCGRYYRVHIYDDSKQQFSMLNVSCPYCGSIMPGKVQKTSPCIIIEGIKSGREPFFGFELWFLTEYRGKLIWALNREHLTYLIDYLSAELREKPSGENTTMRTQADMLPAFFKTAKNREGIIKCLEKLNKK